jgi:predicted DsbA family dithiol-disulfide isomerase
MIEEVCRTHGVPLARIDVEQDLVDGGRELNIVGVPTLIFRENNVEVVRITGLHPRADYAAVIEGLHAS